MKSRNKVDCLRHHKKGECDVPGCKRVRRQKGRCKVCGEVKYHRWCKKGEYNKIHRQLLAHQKPQEEAPLEDCMEISKQAMTKPQEINKEWEEEFRKLDWSVPTKAVAEYIGMTEWFNEKISFIHNILLSRDSELRDKIKNMRNIKIDAKDRDGNTWWNGYDKALDEVLELLAKLNK